MDRARLNQIIKEELDKMSEMAMSDEERAEKEKRDAALARRRERDRERREANKKAERAALDARMKALYPRRKIGYIGPFEEAIAHIEPRFQESEEIYTLDDLVAAVKEGRAKIWTAGLISPAKRTYTIVPPSKDANKADYPYAYGEGSVVYRNGMQYSDFDNSVINVYKGRGISGGNPTDWSPSESQLDNIDKFIYEIVPAPALSGDEADPDERVPGGEQYAAAMEDDPESMLESRWAHMAGILKG